MDGIRISSGISLVLKCVNTKNLCFTGVNRTRRGLVGLKYIFKRFGEIKARTAGGRRYKFSYEG